MSIIKSYTNLSLFVTLETENQTASESDAS